MKPETRILIADDHPIFREGLRKVIERDKDLVVVAEAEDGEEALAQLAALKPDVAILDLDMPKRDGFGVAQALKAQAAPIAIIFLTMHKDEGLFNAALDLGVKGYVLKDSAISDMRQAIRAVRAGQPFISPQLSGYLMNRHTRAADLVQQKPALSQLTPTELRVLRLIAEDQTTRAIADTLCVSIRTIETHRANISQKLDLHGAHALLKFALEHKSELH